jgi:hydrogenase maturation protein HypF
MLPYTPIHHLLLADTGRPLVMTSGNLTEEPIAKDNEEAKLRLHGLADYFLLHNRDIHSRYDDSVALVLEGRPYVVRRARSYAPYPVRLPTRTAQLLAVGAQEKSAFCLTRDAYAFVSQHIGDLENLDTLEHFAATVELYKRLFRIEPELVAHDLHPDYLSTRYAQELAEGLPLIGVQHHHAHVVSCMAENGVTAPVIGIALDGSGYGPDGTVWGGEFMVADPDGYERACRLEPLPLPGGELGIRKPYRLAIAYLHRLLGRVPELPFLVGVGPDERRVVIEQVDKGINTPLTSSCGRLFDAVSALLGVRGAITFEGQAAIELEMRSRQDGAAAPYPFRIEQDQGLREVRLAPVFEAILDDLMSGVPVREIGLRFHQTVAQVICDGAITVREETGLTVVALSGGCFQNRLLLSRAIPLLRQSGFEVLLHRQVPCNDGGIALGQAAISAATLR